MSHGLRNGGTSGRDGTGGAKLSVLVIDDDSDHAAVLEMLLRKFGCQPHVCVDSKDCMSLVERLRPDVVLLDLTMPGMTGFDIAAEIGHNPDLRPIRLVAVSGLARDSDRERTKASGFDAHLQKPVDLEALQGILRTAEQIKDVGRPSEAETRSRAYALWEAAGRPDSEEDRISFWYAAQRELMEERAAAAAQALRA